LTYNQNYIYIQSNSYEYIAKPKYKQPSQFTAQNNVPVIYCLHDHNYTLSFRNLCLYIQTQCSSQEAFLFFRRHFLVPDRSKATPQSMLQRSASHFLTHTYKAAINTNIVWNPASV